MGLMALYLGLLLLLLFVFESFPQESVCVRLPDIYWNATNPIFRIDNTDHIIDVNRDNLPYDQVNIICPVYAPGTKEEDAEKYIIYNVSKEEYDTCRITNPNPRIIAVCDKPYKLMYFTITFRSFTPQPGGLEFRPGQDYYFISTSSRDDLHRRVGGRCSSENMKVVFKVCCQAGDSPSQQTTTGAPALPSGPRLPASTPRSSSSGTTTMIVRRPSIIYPSTSATTSSTTLPSVIRSYYPVTRPPPSKNYNNNANVESTTKRRKGSEKHNEVVKNEELTSGGVRSGGGGLSSSIPRWTPHLAALLLVLITIANPFWRVR